MTTLDEEIVPEQPLRIVDTQPDSLSIQWEGLDTRQYKTITGYVLEYSRGYGAEFVRWNGVLPLKPERGAVHRETVSGLNPDTEYFFRLRVVSKGLKQSLPGPELKGKTSCGAPLEPPQGIKLSADNFDKVNVKWELPDKSTWRCGDVGFVLKWRNNTNSGYLDLPASQTEYVFPTQPGTTWIIQLQTQSLEAGQKGKTSDWSPERRLVTPGPPDEVFLVVKPTGPDTGTATWGIPDGGDEWNYGVDVTYRLTQLGECSPADDHEPFTVYDVKKSIDLSNLQPWSTYEVVITPRMPPHLTSSVNRPVTKKTFRTFEMVPAGPPENLRVDDAAQTSLTYAWEAPRCDLRRGQITQYEYEFEGVDDWVRNDRRSNIGTRTRATIDDLKPGSTYRVRVKAFTSVGPGPWSEWFNYKTPGSEMGPPRELSVAHTMAHRATLHWLPPYPLRSRVRAYKLRYALTENSASSKEVVLPLSDLDCSAVVNPNWNFKPSTEHLCYELQGLQKSTTYSVDVAAQAESGNWGEWSLSQHFTTRANDTTEVGGRLTLLAAGHDNLKVAWVPPGVVGDQLTSYRLGIGVATDRIPQNIRNFTVGKEARTYHFRNLAKTTKYNVTVDGLADKNQLWHIARTFDTTDESTGPLSWLPAPTNLRLLRKTQTVQEIKWDPPEIIEDEYKHLITHYRITYARFNPDTGVTDVPRVYTVDYPNTNLRVEGLEPSTIYNITVQAGTDSGYGGVLWGAYSTLDPGVDHILRLLHRTPTALHVGWDPRWGNDHSGYILVAEPQASVDPLFDLRRRRTYTVENASAVDFVLNDLHPNTIYNVSLTLANRPGGAWGAYATLPPGAFMVKNLQVCQMTNFAVAMSWDALNLRDREKIQYQVRYKKDGNDWGEPEEQRSHYQLRCPGDPCHKLCYLVFNIEEDIDYYKFQVSAVVTLSVLIPYFPI